MKKYRLLFCKQKKNKYIVLSKCAAEFDTYNEAEVACKELNTALGLLPVAYDDGMFITPINAHFFMFTD